MRPTAVDVSALVEYHQVHTADLQCVGKLDQVRKGATAAVEFGDHQLTVRPVRYQQRLAEFGADGEFAGCLVEEDLLAPGGAERVALGSGCRSALDTRPALALGSRADPDPTQSHDIDLQRRLRTVSEELTGETLPLD